VKFPVKENRFLGKKSAHLPNQIKRDHRQFFLHILFASAAAGQNKARQIIGLFAFSIGLLLAYIKR